MPSRSAYKDITLQQLRSFCETARQGSLTAAAATLQLANPTVWKQVHALEKEFGQKLVEPHARGCTLTPAGRILAALTAPAVANVAGLRRAFAEALGQLEIELTIAASARILTEDLPDCLADFCRRWPRVRLTLKDMNAGQILLAVEAGEADLGLCIPRAAHPKSAWLDIQPCYDVDLILITPRNHPLAKKRRVLPADLKGYPLVNSPTTLPDSAVHDAVVKHRLFETPGRSIEALPAAIVRRYVELGMGIALVNGHAAQPRGDLHERSMSQHFGRSTIHVVRRKGVTQSDAALDLIETVRRTRNAVAGSKRRGSRLSQR